MLHVTAGTHAACN